ncbi:MULTISPECIES: type II toxin-antitoxin system VapC family toxin [Barrientosiimonas]|uniref:Ribonuclease VapC n=1 Tax=Barrientosiimonas endolithica TaxID=1535208 RepID=A0ABM8HFR1_9MICO|nr:type II toxin-antitoxin system VapC family toxin [Barrientosiimonas endolithica]BDZ59788.1 ribonuclease VapC42 [Barrientosiimonas endolithica]
MIVDSSALVAVLNDEPRAQELVTLMRDRSTAMSAATYVEAAVVVDARRDPALSRQFDTLLSTLGIAVVDVTPEMAAVARQAYRDFGRGSGHAARLNFGDCFSYALAVVRDEPLLFVGDDFTHTDVRAALR